MAQSFPKSRCLGRLRDERFVSRLIQTSLRGFVREAMVTEAIGTACRTASDGWHPWDLEPRATRLARFPSHSGRERCRAPIVESRRIFPVGNHLTSGPRPVHVARDNPDPGHRPDARDPPRRDPV